MFNISGFCCELLIRCIYCITPVFILVGSFTLNPEIFTISCVNQQIISACIAVWNWYYKSFLNKFYSTIKFTFNTFNLRFIKHFRHVFHRLYLKKLTFIILNMRLTSYLFSTPQWYAQRDSNPCLQLEGLSCLPLHYGRICNKLHTIFLSSCTAPRYHLWPEFFALLVLFYLLRALLREEMKFNRECQHHLSNLVSFNSTNMVGH